MAVTRIKNNQITDLTVNAAAKLQDYSVTSGKIANNLTYGSDLTVTGNLTVQGNVTAIDTIDLVVEDPLILLAKEQTGSPALDIGFIGKRGTEDNIAFVWDESAGQFVAVFTTSEITNTTVSINSYASLQVLNITAANADITGNVTFSGNIVGDLGVTGNITGGNLNSNAAVTGVTITASGNLEGGNAVITGDVSSATVTASGNVLAGNVNSNAAVTGVTVTATGNLVGGNANITNAVNSTSVNATGNVLAGNLNSNAAVTGVTVTASGNLVGNNAVITGDVSTTSLTATGNLSGLQFQSTSTTLRAPTIGNTAGERVRLYDFANVSKTNYAIGVETSAIWMGVDTNLEGQGFKWYGSEIEIARLSAVGNLVLAGNLQANANITGVTITASGNLVGNNAVVTNDVSAASGTFSGNVSAGNISTSGELAVASIAASGNITGGNLVSNADVTTVSVTASGNVDAGNVNSNAAITGVTITASGNLVGGNAVITGDVSAATGSFTGNVTADYFIGNGSQLTGIDATQIQNGNSNVKIATANGNVTISVTGTSNVVVFTPTSVEVDGEVNASGNVLAANINANGTITGASATIAGNVDSGNVNTTGVYAATGDYTGNVVAGNITANADITGVTVTATGNVTGGNIATTGIAQVGFLEVDNNALITGNLVIQGNLTYINVEDLRVEDPVIGLGGGPNGNVLTTNDGMDRGTKMVYYSTSNDQQQAAFMGWDNSTGNLIVAANVTVANNVVTVTDFGTIEGGTLYFANADITGTATIANLETSTISVSGNLSANNLISNNDVTTATVTASGNVVAGNVTANAAVTTVTIAASGNVLAGNVNSNAAVTGVTITASGNLVGNNAVITGDVSTATVTASGNVLAGNVNSNAAVTGVTITASGNLEGNNAVITGDVSTTTVTATGNVNAGNLVTLGNVDGGVGYFTGNVTADTFFGNFAGNVAAGGSNTQIQFNDDSILNGSAAFTFDSTSNLVTVSGNVDAGNLTTTGDVSAATATITGNVLAGNINSNAAVTGITITASGNLEGNNAVITGDVSAATITASGNVIAGNLNSNAAVTGITITASGNLEGNNAVIIGDVSAATGSFSGNIIAGNLNSNAAVTGVTITASGNLEGNNAVITGDVSTATVTATGNVDGGNINTAGQVVATGNITGGNIVSQADVTTVSVTASGNITGGNIEISGQSNLGNIRISGDTITGTNGQVLVNSAGEDVNFVVSGDTQANLLVADAGSDTVLISTGTATTGAALKVGTTDSILVPVGTSAERPGTPVTGMVRFNTSVDALEFYDSEQWTIAGAEFTIIVADEFVGDNSTVTFTLSEDSTTATTLVAINGVLQIPVTAYSVSGNVLTFTEAPESTDVIDARILTTTTTVTGITNAENTAVVETPTGGDVTITGNLVPTADSVYNLGSSTEAWDILYVGDIINANANGIGNIGSETTYFDTVFAKATSAQYADLAEMYEADSPIESGTVVCFGGTKEVTVCDIDSSRKVAGVVSTNPSYLMNSGQTGDYVVAVALQGRVPVKVTGRVRKGDMMVAAGDGRARAEANPAVGSVIGKALADFDGQDGVIEVVIGRV
jgi:hypothetical protein